MIPISDRADTWIGTGTVLFRSQKDFSFAFTGLILKDAATKFLAVNVKEIRTSHFEGTLANFTQTLHFRKSNRKEEKIKNE